MNPNSQGAWAPKVSVILTSFNHEKYLSEAIDSVLNQSFSNFELIIWDDASTDSSWSIISGYADKRIKAFRNEENKRPIFGVRKAIEEVAIGEYIAMHHSDDVWTLGKLEKQVAFLDANSDVAAVFTRVQIIDENGEKSINKWFDEENRSRWRWLHLLFLGQNHLNHPSVLIRKQCYRDVGVYRYGFAQCGDAEMWSRVLLRYPVHVIQENLTLHRLFSTGSNTSGNTTQSSIRTGNEWNAIRRNFLSLSTFQEIVAIFPSLERFRNPEGCNIKFLLAMACLHECKEKNAWQLGLNWLFELISDGDDRREIETLYSFSYVDYIKLTAEFDVYSVKQEREVEEKQRLINERDARLHEIYSSTSWLMVRRLFIFERWLRRIREPKK